MRDVELHIAGRHYRVACAAGEEARLSRLGDIIDSKLAGEPGLAAQSEPRMLLYGALLLADELEELRKSKANSPPAAPTPDVDAAAVLEELAEWLETIAGQLEDAVGNA